MLFITFNDVLLNKFVQVEHLDLSSNLKRPLNMLNTYIQNHCIISLKYMSSIIKLNQFRALLILEYLNRLFKVDMLFTVIELFNNYCLYNIIYITLLLFI